MSIKDTILSNKVIRYVWRSIDNFHFTKQNMYYLIANETYRAEFMHFRSGGDLFPDKVIYIATVEGAQGGFFALYRQTIELAYFAECFHLLPYFVINKSRYNDNEEDNVFDYFFDQQPGLTKENVREALNIIDSYRDHMSVMDKRLKQNTSIIAGYEVDNEYIIAAARIVKKYLIVKKDIKERIQKEIRCLLGEKKTIAIHFRGNAYKLGYYGHPVALTIEDYFDYIDLCLSNGYEQIFIATDDTNALIKLHDRYSGIIKFYDDTKRSDNGLDVHAQIYDRPNNGFLLGYEVLRDMLTMASCDALICGHSQVTIATRIQKESEGNNFGYIHIIDKGFYTSNNDKAIRKYMKNPKYKER